APLTTSRLLAPGLPGHGLAVAVLAVEASGGQVAVAGRSGRCWGGLGQGGEDGECAVVLPDLPVVAAGGGGVADGGGDLAHALDGGQELVDTVDGGLVAAGVLVEQGAGHSRFGRCRAGSGDGGADAGGRVGPVGGPGRAGVDEGGDVLDAGEGGLGLFGAFVGVVGWVAGEVGGGDSVAHAAWSSGRSVWRVVRSVHRWSWAAP